MRFTARNLELVRLALERAIQYTSVKAQLTADRQDSDKRLLFEREEMTKLLPAVELAIKSEQAKTKVKAKREAFLEAMIEAHSTIKAEPTKPAWPEFTAPVQISSTMEADIEKTE